MKPVDRIILGSIFLGLLINLASTFLYNSLPTIHIYAAIILALAIVLWIVYRIINTLLRYFRYGRYAVEVIFLSADNRILLIQHPFHKCLLPPSGRLKLWQLPHQAVADLLQREAGITEFEFHPTFHNPSSMISDKVEDVPRPYAVQMEYRRQRGWIKFHYDFLYVCRFKGGDLPLGFVNGYQPRWMSLNEISQLGKDLRPFDDLIWRYSKVLGLTESNTPPTP